MPPRGASRPVERPEAVGEGSPAPARWRRFGGVCGASAGRLGESGATEFGFSFSSGRTRAERPERGAGQNSGAAGRNYPKTLESPPRAAPEAPTPRLSPLMRWDFTVRNFTGACTPLSPVLLRFPGFCGVAAGGRQHPSTPIAPARLGSRIAGAGSCRFRAGLGRLQGELVRAPAAICRDNPARPVVSPEGHMRHVAALKGEFPLHLA